MKSIPIIALGVVALLCVKLTKADDLTVGENVNVTIGFSMKFAFPPNPFFPLEKKILYSRAENNLIKGIFAIETVKTGAKPFITSGGVGYSFANVTISGEQGKALDYEVTFYV